MAYTVNDFITEGMHIQHSNLYYDILKESDELNLMEQFMMNQSYINGLDIDQREILESVDGYLSESVDSDTMALVESEFMTKLEKVGSKLKEIWKKIIRALSYGMMKIANKFSTDNQTAKKIYKHLKKQDMKISKEDYEAIKRSLGRNSSKYYTKYIHDKRYYVNNPDKFAVTCPGVNDTDDFMSHLNYCLSLALTTDFAFFQVDLGTRNFMSPHQWVTSLDRFIGSAKDNAEAFGADKSIMEDFRRVWEANSKRGFVKIDYVEFFKKMDIQELQQMESRIAEIIKDNATERIKNAKGNMFNMNSKNEVNGIGTKTAVHYVYDDWIKIYSGVANTLVIYNALATLRDTVLMTLTSLYLAR